MMDPQKIQKIFLGTSANIWTGILGTVDGSKVQWLVHVNSLHSNWIFCIRCQVDTSKVHLYI